MTTTTNLIELRQLRKDCVNAIANADYEGNPETIVELLDTIEAQAKQIEALGSLAASNFEAAAQAFAKCGKQAEQIKELLEVVSKINSTDTPVFVTLPKEVEIKKAEDYYLAQIEALQADADADRYRWLKNNCGWTQGGFVVTDISNVRLGAMCPSYELLDAAIDAARKGNV